MKPKMSTRTLKALKGSIKKWEKIVEGTGVDKGYKNCPLCKHFFSGQHSCDNCPVMIKTGIHNCINTPYIKWTNHLDMKHGWDANRAICPDCLKLAKAELRFLKGLLPKEVK